MKKDDLLFNYANPDIMREARTGAPEAVFCRGKKPEQIAAIMNALTAETEENVMGTGATSEDYEAVKNILPGAVYYEEAKVVMVPGKNPLRHGGRLAVVSAGTADIPVAEEAAVVAEILGNDVTRIYDVGVAGIHRLFDRMEEIRACDVVIVVAGMEGALASVVGGMIDKPLIAVPTSIGYGANYEGLSALLSMLNSCASGVGVVNIDNGYGAACLADKITKNIKHK